MDQLAVAWEPLHGAEIAMSWSPRQPERAASEGMRAEVEYAKERQAWLAWVRGALQGPRAGDDEELSRSPLECYCSGILTPAPAIEESGQAESLHDALNVDKALTFAAEATADGDPAATDEDARPAILPTCSVGLSFLVTPDARLEVLIKGATYDYKPRSKDIDGGQAPSRWIRKPFATAPGECEFRPPPRSTTVVQPILNDGAEVSVRWRKHNKNWLVTVALVNRRKPGGNPHYAEELAKASFFQTQLTCAPLRGRILPYPRLEGVRLTPEEEELELQYRDKKVFAIGHGTASDWTLDGHGEVRELAACFLPTVEVPLVTTHNPDLPERTLDLAFLAECDKRPEEVIDELEAFVSRYAAWVEQECSAQRDAEASAKSVMARIIKRQCEAVDRMRRGCKLLRTDLKVQHAFSLGQAAMLQQMIHVRMVQGHKTENVAFKWRPFQLAFLLLALESVIDPESAERDLVDLLWFPTGGGKTEAYLALIAVTVIYRRLQWPTSYGGTAVIMRYTLRLLTAQQFQRATALICALELMRRKVPRELGSEPITGGLWVGGASTPNRNEEAVKILAELMTGPRGSHGLFLDQCPWCGTPIVPSSEDGRDSSALGIRREGKGIMFFCPSRDCDFHDRLPLHVVDEHLYEHPPTLLLATVDKFARLTWEDRATAFLGHQGRLPPQLIIQDELHLIAGPLGSFAGLYEAAIDTVLRMKAAGTGPKYIASTATIRHATEQVLSLYGRKMAVFPPPGHSCDDSFFARTDRVRPGRLYVGLCGQSPFLNWRETLAVAAATSLAVPTALQWQGILQDAWWTLVIYHGSLRGVGQSHRLALHDIPENLSRLLAAEEAREEASADGQTGNANSIVRELHREGQVKELTGRVDAAGIQDVLRRLQKACDDPESVSLVLCTNMLSVGIDISRLALMIVNGQPLTTAEYIQASSRVGRDRVPGIVMVNYNRQPRDLSHFENFRPYHESFYRFVEPTSVTPFSAPARHLALHAALVILMRHGVGLGANDDAFKMTTENGRVKKIIGMFLDRCRQADPESAAEVEEQTARLLTEWQAQKQHHHALLYVRKPKEPMFPALLRNIFDPPEKGLWETMQSMRSVDRVSELRIVGPHKPGGAGGRHAGS